MSAKESNMEESQESSSNRAMTLLQAENERLQAQILGLQGQLQQAGEAETKLALIQEIVLGQKNSGGVQQDDNKLVPRDEGAGVQVSNLVQDKLLQEAQAEEKLTLIQEILLFAKDSGTAQHYNPRNDTVDVARIDWHFKKVQKDLFHLGFDTSSMPSWEKLAPMPKKLYDISVANMDDFRFVVVGTYDGQRQALVYDSRSNSWTSLPPLNHAQVAGFMNLCKVACVDGKIYTFYQWSVECLDLSASELEWTVLDNTIGTHNGAAVTVNKCIYVFKTNSRSLHIFDTESGEVTNGPNAPFIHWRMDLFVTKNGNRIFAFQKNQGTIYFLTVDEQSGMPDGQWNILNARPPREMPRSVIKLISTEDSLVFVPDFLGDEFNVLNLQRLFWWRLPRPSISRMLKGGVVVLGNSQIVVFGHSKTEDADMESLQVQLPPPAPLSQRCELVLANHLSRENVLNTWDKAAKYGASNLVQSCLDFIQEHGRARSRKRNQQDSE